MLILGANENDIGELNKANGQYEQPINTEKTNISFSLEDARLTYHKSLPLKKLKIW